MSTIAAVARAAKKRDLLRYELETADLQVRLAILAALGKGVSAKDVAEAAGVSRARVYQIKAGG